MRRRITESLDLDADSRRWLCHDCGQDLGSAMDNYKTATLVRQRDPREIWQPLISEKYNFSYNPGWMRLVEFYCPGCALLMDVEVLPPGHPITHDIELDLDHLGPVRDGSVDGAVAVGTDSMSTKEVGR